MYRHCWRSDWAAIDTGAQIYRNYHSNGGNLGQAVLSVNVGEVVAAGAAGAALTFGAAVMAPVAVAVAGDALVAGGLATGSTTLFSAGISAYETSTAIGATIYGVSAAKGVAEENLTFYRGQEVDTPLIKSNAAQQGGVAYSQLRLATKNIDDLMAEHALDPKSPLSPFISVTTDPNVARYYARGGVVYELSIPVDQVVRNPYNEYSVQAGLGYTYTPEVEWLVRNYIHPDWIVSKTFISSQ